MKRLLAFSLAVVLLLSIVPAYAFPGYSEDGDETVEGFAEAYGWDTEAINSDKWDGKPDNRLVEQRQLEEAYATTPEQLEEIARRYGDTGKVPVIEEYGRSSGHQLEAFMDQLEADELMAYEFGLINSVGSSGNGAQQMVEVALGELGHDNSVDNRYGSVTGMGINQFWCCSFISYCAKECGFIESGLYAATASCINMSTYMTETNGFQKYYFEEIVQFGGSGYSVVPGDLYFFSTGSGSSHIALIAESTSDSFTTVEGLNGKNAAGIAVGRVAQRTFSASQLYSTYETMNGWVVHVEYPNTFFSGDFDGVDDGTIEGRKQMTYDFITQVWGLNSAAACGIMANIEAESNFNPLSEAHNQWEDSYGICQWNNHWGLWDQCKSFCSANGYDPRSLIGQLYYMQYYVESDRGDRRNTANLMQSVANTADGAYQVAYSWCIYCEKPGDMYTKANQRGNNAKFNYWPLYGNK